MNSITAIKILFALVQIFQYFIKHTNESALIKIGQDKANDEMLRRIIADEVIARRTNSDVWTDKDRELIDDLFGERQ